MPRPNANASSLDLQLDMIHLHAINLILPCELDKTVLLSLRFFRRMASRDKVDTYILETSQVSFEIFILAFSKQSFIEMQECDLC